MKVDVTYVQGATVKNSVMFPDGKAVDMDANVDLLDPGKELRQSGGILGVLAFRRQWLLEPVDGGTGVVQHEVDRGFCLWFWDSEWVEPAYQRTVEALKTRVLSNQE